MPKITLIYIATSSRTINWQSGDCVYGGNSVEQALAVAQNAATSDYILIADVDRYILCEEQNIHQIIERTHSDVIHIGLKLNHNNFPSLYDYYQPTWMYSLNAPSDIASTSWRLSADCMLIRSNVLSQFSFDGFDVYQSPIALGHDWGYRMLKAGMIIRYDPSLAELQTDIEDLKPATQTDECSFMFRNIGSKWTLWSIFSKCLMPHITLRPLVGLLLASKKRVVNPAFKHERLAHASVHKNATVSVFTPTLQRYSYLAEELRQLREQTIPPSQIIITDQTDLDKREQEWLNEFTDLPIVYQPQEEKGQCNAWNFCLQHATGEYVLFLGDDADEIKPDFIEQLLQTMETFKADVVACNIKEGAFDYPFKQQDVFITDTFPICLVRKSIFQQSGGYDYAFNKGIRADADVAIRIHLNGGLLVLNPDVKIHHHRAPVGGLRHHGERKVSNTDSRNNVRKFQLPSFTELYLYSRYFSPLQQQQMYRLKKLSMLSVKGGLTTKLARLFIYIMKKRSINADLKVIESKYKALRQSFPSIPTID